MGILRNILSVIIGYATFVISAVLLFRLSGIDPHEEPSVGIMILVIAYGVAFSFLGGLLAQVIAKTKRPIINYVLAAIMAGFATFSFFKSTGNHYTQVAAIFLFAPASIAGGLTYIKRIKK